MTVVDETMVLVYNEDGTVFHLRNEGRVPLCDPGRERGMLTQRRSAQATGSRVCEACAAFADDSDGMVRGISAS